MALKYDFTGSLALVTGGASGIGRTVANALAESNALVIIADINLDGASEAVKDLKGENHSAFPVDVSSEESVKILSQSISSKYERCPSVVIHAAGTVAWPNRHSVFQIELSDWKRVIDVNLTGTFLIDKIFGQQMRDQRITDGAIVNFSSISARRGTSILADYCASKAGVDSITHSFGRELASSGIRVNAVAPFVIDAPMSQQLPSIFLEKSIQASPSKRAGKPDEVADLCLFLASKHSLYINCQSIAISGGY